MKEITLTRGKVALVEDEDFERFNQFKWYFGLNYAVRNSSLKNGKRKKIFMHREILGEPSGLEVDHINGDRLDNRRGNLRACSHAQNQKNMTRPRNNTSGFKGVSFRKDTNKWQVRICIDKKQTHIGCFDSARRAALVYDFVAREIYGEFAKTNFFIVSSPH